MPYCKAGQAEIYYEAIGEGIPLLMLHGFSLDHRMMSGCMEPIFTDRLGWKRIYLDLPGMGQSKEHQDISSSDEMLDAVLAFIDAIMPNQAFVIAGESYGGYIARGIIEKRKELVLGSAFICSLIIPDPEKRNVDKHHVLRMDKDFLHCLTKEELEVFSNNQVILDEYNWKRFHKEIVSGAELADQQLLQKVRMNYGFSFEIDQSDFLNPALFLLGRQDASVGYKDALELISHYPKGTFAVLDMAGHNLQIEQKEVFDALMQEWLDRVEYYLKREIAAD